MKRSVFSTLLFLSGLAVPAIAGNDSPEIVDPNYDPELAIKTTRDKRNSAALDKFKNDPRESTLRLTMAPSLLFGMHGDLSDGDGRGFNASMLVQANSDTPDFKFLIGGELLAFTAESDSGGNEVRMSTLNLMLSLGFAYDFTPHFATGVLFGYGLVGGTYIEEDFADGSSDTNGTMNTVLSLKPYAELMLNKNFSIYAAYRFVYMGSSVISDAADWSELETASHAVELGFSYRF